MAQKPEFEYFPWDVDPIDKYKQPKPNSNPPENSYPDDDIDRTGTKTYGRYVENAGQKKHKEEMRGYGAAERGREFYCDDTIRDPVRTKTK